MNNSHPILYVIISWLLSVVFGAFTVSLVSIIYGATPAGMVVCLLAGHWILFPVLFAVGKGWIGVNCGLVV